MAQITMYTDGSSLGNPGPGGYGVVLISGPYRKEITAGYRLTTNNRMELMAVIVGLEALTKPCQVTVVSDSKYVTDAFNQHWIEGWLKNNWKNSQKKPVKNKSLWLRLLKAMEPHQVSFTWIKGHAGHPENERCDALAVAAGAGAVAAGMQLPQDPGYQPDEPGLL